MNTLEMTIENRKRIIALEQSPPKYDQVVLLTRLGIVEKRNMALTKEVMLHTGLLKDLKRDIETLQNACGVSVL